MNFNRTNHHRSFCAISACLIATFSLNPLVLADVAYVDGGVAACDNEGDNWGEAFKYLQDALDFAANPLNNVTQIWVRAGTYYADQSCANEDGSGDRTETFQLVEDVFLLGGFDGTETFAFERNAVDNPTFLSGALAQDEVLDPCAVNLELSCFEEHGEIGCFYDIDPQCCVRACEAIPECCNPLFGWDAFCVAWALENCGGSYHVVTAGSEIDDTEKTVIDGFTIQDGTANGTVDLDKQGGGMLIRGEPSVVRCIFTQNSAWTKGGGIAIDGNAIQPDIINSVFHHNPGDQGLTVQNGGGLASFLADAMLVNCLFWENLAQKDGGAIHNDVGFCMPAPSGPQCGRITLVNCTLDSNTANTLNTVYDGGGLFNAGTASICDVDSSIFWANLPDQIDGQLGGSAVDYSDVQDGSPISGSDNIDDLPLFVAAGAGDYRLTILSPCIDVGNDDASIIPCDFFDLDIDGRTCDPDPDEATPDLDLINRILDGNDDGTARVDIGSYEFRHPDVCSCADICPWDLDGDCSVGASDLLALLVAWGPCGDCGNCPADFDGSCTVGASDLLALLANWGLCDCSEGTPPLPLEDELADACLTQADWDAFVAVMTDPESSQEDKDNYLCWMEHYLYDCNKCFCVGASGCPGPDPFD